MKLLFKSLKLLEIVKMRKYLLFLFCFAIVTSVLETLSIGSVLPLMQIVFNSSEVIILNNLNQDLFKNVSDNQLLILMILIIISIFFIKNLVVFINNFFQLKYVLNFQIRITKKLLNSYLDLTYEKFLSKNSSFYFKNLTLEILALSPFFTQVLILGSEIIILIGITSFLFWVNLKLSFILILIFASSALIYITIIKRRIKSWGEYRERCDTQRVKNLNHIFCLFTELKSKKIRNYFVKIFCFNTEGRYKTDFKEFLVNSFPRIYLEMIFIVTILSIATYLLFEKSEDEIKNIMPFIGLFVIYSIRLVPSTNKIIYAYQTFKYRSASVNLFNNEYFENIKNFDAKNNLIEQDFKFENNLTIKNVDFSYHKLKPIFLNLNLEIKKNSFIGIMGKSGSGKSTLLGLIYGLLNPSKGKILVDDKINISENYFTWISKISLVSQNVFLVDDTIKKNIALGEHDTEIDQSRLSDSIKISQLTNLINDLDKGINTTIGERGVRLSGGQIQRIGIARALYKKAEILILDESTNALDKETEKDFLNFIYELKKIITIIFVTHKMNVLKDADSIYEIKEKKLNKIK